VRKTIVVIDDQEGITRSLRTALAIENIEVIPAATGSEGLAKVRAHSPDAVLVDIMLPDISGLELIAAIRRSYPSTPIIAASGDAGGELAAQARMAGADGFLAKPLKSSRILSILLELT